ncbi:MAG TPA: bluetail domain-containing putative surface protein, partial [Rhizomicrobium sp.]|nr:bluetail domain-containing putative surface protein [Rhizomicrobium sp.]
GGASRENLDGGDGNDILQGGGGRDIFIFSAPSLAGNMDHVLDFEDHELLVVHRTITAFDAAVDHSLSSASFTSDLQAIGANLHQDHAVVFTASSGDLAGHRFLLIGADGTVGYNAGTDWVIEIDGSGAIGLHSFRFS